MGCWIWPRGTSREEEKDLYDHVIRSGDNEEDVDDIYGDASESEEGPQDMLLKFLAPIDVQSTLQVLSPPGKTARQNTNAPDNPASSVFDRSWKMRSRLLHLNST